MNKHAQCFYEEELPSDLSILDRLYPVLQDWCAAGGLGFSEGHRVIVAVTEAVTNAVIHAVPGHTDATVFVSLTVDGACMRADVGDQGHWGWTAPSPPTAEEWERTGGRGLELIRQLAHAYDIRPRQGGGTLVSMTFNTQKTNDDKYQDGVRHGHTIEGGKGMDSRVESFDDIDVMRITGRIDLVTSNTLKDNIRERLQRRRSSLVLNMERVDFINSSGLGAMVSILKDVRLAEGRLVLSNLAPYVQEIFEITQLSNVFEIYGTEDAAIMALSDAKTAASAK